MKVRMTPVIGLYLAICGTVIGFQLAFPSEGKASSYTFTKIADTSGPLLGFFSAPTVNNSGAVAFSGRFDAGGSGIFSGTGGPLATLADTGGFLSDATWGAGWINDAGTVAFKAALDSGGSGLFTADGVTLLTVLDESGPFSGFGVPALNKDGTLAFFGLRDTGFSGIFTTNGTTTTTIADSTGTFLTFDVQPALNTAGTVVFRGLMPGGVDGIFAGNGGAIQTIADNTSVPFSNFSGSRAINDAGTVAFGAQLAAGGSGIFLDDGTGNTTIADSSGPFSIFGGSGISINNEEEVAFVGFLDSGGSGIYTGPDPVADKVIAIGDFLFGSTVVNLAMSQRAFNDFGQIAFWAALADGRLVVVRANNESIVPGIEAAIDIKPGSYPNSINLNSNGVLAVAILTTPEFDVSTVDDSLDENGIGRIFFSDASARLKGKSSGYASLKDVDGDGDMDLVIQFYISEIDPSLFEEVDGVMYATVTGSTVDGIPFSGKDTIHISKW